MTDEIARGRERDRAPVIFAGVGKGGRDLELGQAAIECVQAIGNACGRLPAGLLSMQRSETAEESDGNSRHWTRFYGFTDPTVLSREVEKLSGQRNAHAKHTAVAMENQP